MFNVIRIPTKFSRTIKRFSQREKSELLDMLILIGDGDTITIPDTIVGDTITLIYGEWMNMESKNGNKPEKALIQYSSEYVAPSYSGPRVEYNRVEDSIVEENKIILSKDNTDKSEIVKVDKRDLDRDLEKYKKKCGINAENVKKRWNKETIPTDTNYTTGINGILIDTNYTYNDNDNDNDKIINNSLQELEQSSEIVKVDKSNIEINELEQLIKTEVINLGLMYKKGKYERERIKNILTGKDYGNMCELVNMNRIQFTLEILKLSTKLDFWNGKIYNAETIYKHYAQIYNEAKRIKIEKEQKKPGMVRV